MKKRLRIGMIGGGIGGQVGKWHRHAMSLDNKYELVAGCFSSNIENGINSANELGIDLSRNYPDFETMAAIKILIMASGAFAHMELLEVADFNAIGAKAAQLSGSYKAPGQ